MINKIHNMDCVEGIRFLPDNSVDLTVTSPPYDNLRRYGGNFDWNFDKFKRLATELFRVTKIGGVVVWVVGDQTIKGSESATSFRQALFLIECGFKLHDTMIYEKNNPVPQADKTRYTQSFEYMFVFSKGKPKTVNRIMDPCQHTGKVHFGKNIWRYNVGINQSSKDKIASKVPAIFPEYLARDHILSWSKEGDNVLDPFMGSGTTAKMALKNGRNFIGFEISEEYCKIAEERLKIERSKTDE